MKNKALSLFFLFILVSGLYGEVFRFQYNPGDRYRFVSTVEEDVEVNGAYAHTAEIINKVSVEVEEVRGESGFLISTFNTTHRVKGDTEVPLWGDTYLSRFWRNEFGVFSEDQGQFMPVVRNVPVFPERNLEPGDTWMHDGYEVHDFRPSFGIPEAYSFPIKVLYTYKGRELVEGRELHLISIYYTVFYRPIPPRKHTGIYPVKITGFSKQLLYWDNVLGRPQSYSEEFEMNFYLNDGQYVCYSGIAEAEVIDSPTLDRGAITRDIERALSEGGVESANVEATEEGVKITLENIQFMPDSAVLLPSEKKKLDLIGEILSRYPDRDILIVGHTAYAKTLEGMQILSEERAQAVAEYLLERGVRTLEGMIVQGKGGSMPIADNSTEEGMRRNRRVEITLLEN